MFTKQFRTPVISGMNPAFGKNPTPADKAVQVSTKLGMPGIAGMQGAPVNIFDTVTIVSNTTTRQTLKFFVQTSNKSRNFSNWQQGQLNAGETMVFSYLYLYTIITSAADLNADGTAISSLLPIGASATSKNIAYGMCTFSIANSAVFKDYLLLESLPMNNPDTTGITVVDSAVVPTATTAIFGATRIKLPTMPVVPPNQKIELDIDLPPFPAAVTANTQLVAVLGRQGSIFSSKTTF